MTRAKQAAALLLSFCLLVGMTVMAFAAETPTQNEYEWFTQIDGVRFDGGPYLYAIDFSAVVRDASTLSDKTLRLYYYNPSMLDLCTDASDPMEIHAAAMRWIANFVFSDKDVGVAVLDAYPGARANIKGGENAVYILAAEEGALFDDTQQYVFSSSAFYKNAFRKENGKYAHMCWFDLPEYWFSYWGVTKAQGDTVYEMTLVPYERWQGFYDTLRTDSIIWITGTCPEAVCSIESRPIAIDPQTGALTIELYGADGKPGARMFGQYLINGESVIRYTFHFPIGLLSCGAAYSMYMAMEVDPAGIDGMPMRDWTRDSVIGSVTTRLLDAIDGTGSKRSMAAAATILALNPWIMADCGRTLKQAVESLENGVNDFKWIYALLNNYKNMFYNIMI